MIEASSSDQDCKSDEERILEYVNGSPEGCSIFSVVTGLQIKRTHSEFILEQLRKSGQIDYDHMTKTYYPVPDKETKGSSDQVAKSDPLRYDRSNDCRFCEASNISTAAKNKHEAHCPKNPERMVRSNKGNSQPMACRYCGEVRDTIQKCRSHETFCKMNPDRKLAPGERAKMAKDNAGPPPPPLETVAQVEPTEMEALTELKSEDVPEPPRDHVPYPYPEMDGDVQSNSIPVPVMNGTPRPEHWGDEVQVTATNEPKNVTMVGTGTVQYSIVGAELLALFARQHRTRVGREISELRKVERKLRRHAASAGAMADRVRSARRIKERELRRFERDLAEAVR